MTSLRTTVAASVMIMIALCVLCRLAPAEAYPPNRRPPPIATCPRIFTFTRGFVCPCPGFDYSSEHRRCIPECNAPCVNQGVCIDVDTCWCPPEWTGDTCSSPICRKCVHGDCVDPEDCRCHEGWRGQTCQIPICTQRCHHGGHCVEPDICNCTGGWEGSNCSQAICTPPCQNGRCYRPDHCQCQHGWTGLRCDQARCSRPCKNGGQCTHPEYCSCGTDWTGPTCDQPVCRATCANGGTCTAPSECTCAEGWSGNTCQQAVCNPPCANGGHCVAPNVCNCGSGITDMQSGCTVRCDSSCVHGICVGLNQCSCEEGWQGNTCNEPICLKPCENGGECIGPNQCNCPAGWDGQSCDQPVCHPPCQNGGSCINPGQCQCTSSWSGLRCQEVYRVGEDLKETDCAVVHGVVKSVSPVKTSKAGEPYYQFYLADGKKMIKGVGYKDSLCCQEELSKMKSKPVALVNCTIKRCLFDRDEREVSVQKRTKLESSNMEMVDESPSICEEEITVDAVKVKDLKVGQYVALTVKVVSVKPVTQVRAIGKIVDCQNVNVADKSGSVRVTFWNEDVDKVSEGFSYALRGGVVKIYDGEKYVSMSSKCSVEKIEDLGEVYESDQVMSSGSQFEVIIGEITGCSVVDKYRSCLFCSGKVEGQRCCKCGARVKPDYCPLEICAKIHVVEADLEKNARNITLHVFTKHILEITKKSIQDLQNVSGDEICDMIVEGCGVVTVKYRNGVLKDVIMH